MRENFFIKSHGLGNEYIVLDDDNINFEINTNSIIRLCNVNYGIGSDGILLKVKSDKADFGLKIFNPDGSEAEKSGNGLRIFCKYLFDYGFTNNQQFTVETAGGIVTAFIDEIVNEKAKIITVEMGKAIFNSKTIPTNFEENEVIDKTITIKDKDFKINCVSVGNPHCIVIKEQLDINEIKTYGSLIENYPMFPNRINVQFVKVIDRHNAEILIWERGAGFTLASGSSSSAVACILKKRGLIDNNVTIKMIGGNLKLEISENWDIKMTGEVRQICDGFLNPELINDIKKPMHNTCNCCTTPKIFPF